MPRNVRCGVIQARCEWSPEKYSLADIKEKMIAKHEKLIAAGLAEVGDKVVVISGSPPGSPGSTNDLRVHTIGDAINAVAPVWDSGEHAD